MLAPSTADGLWAGSLPGDFAAELAELVGSTVFIRHAKKGDDDIAGGGDIQPLTAEAALEHVSVRIDQRDRLE
jgi:hypothetical protein